MVGRWDVRRLWIVGWAVGLLLACGGEEGQQSTHRACDEGEVVRCACPDGVDGLKQCDAATGEFGDCQCGGAPHDVLVGDAAPDGPGGGDAAPEATDVPDAPDGAPDAPDDAPCVPACGGRTCGPDGCGGACGACGDGQTCLEGGCASGTCGAANPAPAGTLQTSVAPLSFDTVTAALVHKRDVDAWEDGCLVSVELTFLRGSGCRLIARSGGAYDVDGRLGLLDVVFVADSQCPGFDDADEGEYHGGSADLSGSLTSGVTTIPGADVTEACLSTTLVLALEGTLTSTWGAKELVLAPTTLEVTGEFVSTGSYAVSCPCVPDCSGRACGDDGCGGSCGACGGQDACVTGSCVCQPACAGRECGPDGCGATCGSCAAGYLCGPDGACELDCTPQPVSPCTVTFQVPVTLEVPQDYVWVTGSFTGWAESQEAGALALQLTAGEAWRAEVAVPAGPYEYKYLVKWPDTLQQWCVVDALGQFECTGSPNLTGVAACGTTNPCN